MSYLCTPAIDESQHAGPTFAAQGLGMERVLFELGLLSDAFYDSIAPAPPKDIAALEGLWGSELPSGYRRFLQAAGGSLGPLRVVDWRSPWDFRPASVLKQLRARPAAELEGLRARAQLPIALLGETLEVGYDHPVCLLLHTDSGQIVPEDPDRRAYEDLAGLLLEWGHRVLDPHMAVPGPRLRAWHPTRLSPGRIQALHELAAQQRPGGRFVGRWLGVYRYHRSGLLLRLDAGNQLWVELRAARRVPPEETAAGAVLREARARGWVQA